MGVKKGVAFLLFAISLTSANLFMFSFVLTMQTGDSYAFHDTVKVEVFRQGRLVFSSMSPNLITNAGQDVISRQTGCGATSAPACANGGIYIALTTDSTAPAAGDTTCTSELTTNGLGRALGTYAHTASTNTHTITKTFTYTGSSAVVIAKVCMFDASSSGNMFAETLLASTATVNANGDQVTITWTFNH